jgi:hypothetical protein
MRPCAAPFGQSARLFYLPMYSPDLNPIDAGGLCLPNCQALTDDGGSWQNYPLNARRRRAE